MIKGFLSKNLTFSYTAREKRRGEEIESRNGEVEDREWSRTMVYLLRTQHNYQSLLTKALLMKVSILPNIVTPTTKQRSNL